MATIYDLNISLDLNNNSNVLVDCKQFDDINLIFKIFLDSEAINLKDFDVRLKALKPDETLLIQQGTGVSVADNVLTINASEQLTTTSGKTKIELQFINKITKKKKSTYNIILTVHESIADVDRGISKSAYTLLEEMETKLDQVSDFLTSADEIAKLGNEIKQTVAEGKNVEATLKIDIDNGNTLKTSLEKDINDVNAILPDLKDNVSKATELEPKLTQATKDGGTLKSDLSEKITEGNDTSASLTQANTTATTTKTSLDESIKKASDLIESNKDIAGLTNTVNQLSNPSLLINGDFQVWQRGTTFENVGADQYQADRWQVVSTDGNYLAKVTKVDDGLRIEQEGGGCVIRQYLEQDLYNKIKDKKLTYSMSKDGKIENGNFTIGILNGKPLVELGAGRNVTINWVKLELGEKATPFIPRLYGEELALCQRFYQNINLYKQNYFGVGVLNSAGGTDGTLRINLSVPLRQYPTIILKGELSIIPSSSVTINALSPDLLSPTICKAGATLSKELPVGVYMVEGKNAEDILSLDAEIY